MGHSKEPVWDFSVSYAVTPGRKTIWTRSGRIRRALKKDKNIPLGGLFEILR
jgi:hypothetical protein